MITINFLYAIDYIWLMLLANHNNAHENTCIKKTLRYLLY